MINDFLEILLFILLSLLPKSNCCLYEGRQINLFLSNGTFVESARSIVECTLQCQRLKKIPFFTVEDEKCFCLENIEDKNSSVEHLITGLIFTTVEVKSFSW